MKLYIKPHLDYELAWWSQGFRYVAGLDEAGRGAWAGPVTAAAVIFPPLKQIPEALRDVADSKLLSAAQRESLFKPILDAAIAWGIGWATPSEIDAFGIVTATRQAMMRAISSLSIAPQVLLCDALRVPEIQCAQQALVRGDRISFSIAAASILAKVCRDHWMIAAERHHPGYGFAQHKGYGTSHHRRALAQLGICDLHRRSFSPVACCALSETTDYEKRRTS